MALRVHRAFAPGEDLALSFVWGHPSDAWAALVVLADGFAVHRAMTRPVRSRVTFTVPASTVDRWPAAVSFRLSSVPSGFPAPPRRLAFEGTFTRTPGASDADR